MCWEARWAALTVHPAAVMQTEAWWATRASSSDKTVTFPATHTSPPRSLHHTRMMAQDTSWVPGKRQNQEGPSSQLNEMSVEKKWVLARWGMWQCRGKLGHGAPSWRKLHNFQWKEKAIRNTRY